MIASEIGNKYPYAIVPAAAMTPKISCVAYAVDDNASDAKTAKPTALPMVWCGASAVESGLPIKKDRNVRGGVWFVSRSMMGDFALSLLIILKTFSWDVKRK